MRIRIMKGITAILLCASMVLSNISYAGASLSDNSNSDIHTNEEITDEDKGTVSGNLTDEIDNPEDKNSTSDGNLDETPDKPVDETPTEDTEEEPIIISEDAIPLASGVSDNIVTEAVISAEINGIGITLTGSSEAIPEGSVLQVTELEPQTVETEIVDEALETEEKEKKVKIQKYRAFDIKIMNGKDEIQPGENVRLSFSGDLLVPDGKEEIDIYHVDDASATVLSVKEEVKEDEIIAVTESFSTYVLVIKEALTAYTVTSKYFLTKGDGTAKQIYRPTEEEIQISDSSDVYTISCNDIKGNMDKVVYHLDKVQIKNADGTLNHEMTEPREPYQFNNKDSKDLIIEMYYSEVANEFPSPVTFFDYDVWGTGRHPSRKDSGINSIGKNIKNGTYLSIGQTGTEYSYALPMEKDVEVSGRMQRGRDLDANYNNVNNGDYYEEGYDAIVPGIVESLSGEDYETLNMGVNKNGRKIVEPGLFSNTPVNGKTIYDEFQLNFQQIGNRYVLLNAEDTKTGKKTTAVELNDKYEKKGNVSRDFFPLNEVESNKHPDDNENWYFGMRYDFDFSLKDYVGPLSYSFEGDDDLWVFLDGKLILDLGGMHSTYPGTYKQTPEENTVNLWEKLISADVDTESENWWDYLNTAQKKKYDEARTKTHTVTVLYMERGGYDSSCYMDFVIPNVSERTPVITTTPKINLEFDKVNAFDESQVVADAKFSLVQNDDNAKKYTASSDSEGKVIFKGMQAGIYTLSETEAPKEYIRSNKKWQVQISGSTQENMKYKIFKLNNQGNPISPAVYDSSTANGVRFKITNTPILDYDVKGTKVAKVVSWDDRTYNITLGAYHTTQLQQETDVVLVLDSSASMTWITSQDAERAGLKKFSSLSEQQKNALKNECSKSGIVGQSGWDYKYYAKNPNNEYQPIYYDNGNWYFLAANGDGAKQQDGYAFTLGEYLEVSNGIPMTKLATLQTSVKDYLTNFRNAAQQLSGNDSKVAIVTFSNNAFILRESVEVATMTDAQIAACVDGLETKITGGTRQDLGLVKAADVLEKMSEDHDQYAILFTDGKPNGVDVSGVSEKATAIKQKNAQIYSVGICSGNDTENATIKEVLNSCASDTEKVYYSENAEGLMAAFSSIWSLFSGEQKADIVDYIDSRFELTEGTKKVITDNGGEISIDNNGITYITWRNQNIAYGSTENPGWMRSFIVRAKAEYAGGNDILTNGSGSGITPEGGSKIEFPKPTVNVKVQFNLSDAKDVFFLGETIGDLYQTPTEFLSLFDIEVSTDHYALTQLIYQIENNKKTYTDLRDVTAEITGTVGTGDLGQRLEAVLKQSPKESKTDYKDIFTLTVKPQSRGADSASAMIYEGTVSNNMDENGNPLFQKDGKWYYAVPETLSESADFTAYVVDGKLDITKTIDRYYESKEVTNHIKDNQTFIFKVERYEKESEGVYTKDMDFGDIYETISFSDIDMKNAGKDVFTKTKSIIGLKKGYYKVTEEENWSWKYDQKETTRINGIDGQAYIYIGDRTEQDSKASFIGLDKEERSYAGAGRYFSLIQDKSSQEYKDITELTDTSNSETKTAEYKFRNEFTTDSKKKKWLGDVSILTNVFE